jgi:hypothetical protein
MSRYIAFYLPQFHPIPENDKWYGKGFTEWTNVAKARPLFPGHYEPHIPADLGFYDLRLHDIIVEQAKMAREYGIEGFCYWHYWFEPGKQLLEMPFQDLVNDKNIDIGFSLAWANESWEKKLWNSNEKNQVIAEQKYLGEEDYKQHFYTLLNAFKDERYTKVDGKLFFIIYRPLASPEIPKFITVWRKLAEEEGLPGFFFVAKDAHCGDKEKLLNLGFDAIYDDNALNIHHEQSIAYKVALKIGRDVFHMPTVFRYKDAIKHMLIAGDRANDVFPLVLPNWDHSPRSGRNSLILDDCDPKYFKELLKLANQYIKKKPSDRQIIMIRAWNEWGEGNHLEPDLKYGRGYLEVLREVSNN